MFSRWNAIDTNAVIMFWQDGCVMTRCKLSKKIQHWNLIAQNRWTWLAVVRISHLRVNLVSLMVDNIHIIFHFCSTKYHQISWMVDNISSSSITDQFPPDHHLYHLYQLSKVKCNCFEKKRRQVSKEMFRNVRLSIQDTPTPAHATHTTHTAYFKTKCQTWFFYKLIFSALHLWCLIKLFEVKIHSTECGSVPPRLLWNLREGQLGRLLADAECQSNQIVCQTEELGWAFHFKKIADYEANDLPLKEDNWDPNS